MFWSAGCSLLSAESFSCSLDVLCGRLGTSKLQFLSNKKIKKKNFQLYFFQNFCSSKPWIRIRNRIHLKCWNWIRIRIRIQWIQIHNTGDWPLFASILYDPWIRRDPSVTCVSLPSHVRYGTAAIATTRIERGGGWWGMAYPVFCSSLLPRAFKEKQINFTGL